MDWGTLDPTWEIFVADEQIGMRVSRQQDGPQQVSDFPARKGDTCLVCSEPSGFENGLPGPKSSKILWSIILVPIKLVINWCKSPFSVTPIEPSAEHTMAYNGMIICVVSGCGNPFSGFIGYWSGAQIPWAARPVWCWAVAWLLRSSGLSQQQQSCSALKHAH